MDRRELQELADKVRETFASRNVTVAAVTGTEVTGQVLTVVYEDQRYPIPTYIFDIRDASYIANQIVMVHEIAQKTPPPKNVT